MNYTSYGSRYGFTPPPAPAKKGEGKAEKVAATLTTLRELADIATRLGGMENLKMAVALMSERN